MGKGFRDKGWYILIGLVLFIALTGQATGVIRPGRSAVSENNSQQWDAVHFNSSSSNVDDNLSVGGQSLLDGWVGIGGGGQPPTCAIDMGAGNICNVNTITSGTGSSQALRLFGLGGVIYVADYNDDQGAVTHAWYFDGEAGANKEMELTESEGLWVEYNLTIDEALIIDYIHANANNWIEIFDNVSIDIDTGDAGLILDSELNRDSCIYLTEGNGAFGTRICNDGSGVNRFTISNAETGVEYITIDRESGLISFYNDTAFHENVTVHVTYVNVSETLTAEEITANLFNGTSMNLTEGIRLRNSVTGYSDTDGLYFYLTGDNIEYRLYEDAEQRWFINNMQILTLSNAGLYSGRNITAGDTLIGSYLQSYGGVDDITVMNNMDLGGYNISSNHTLIGNEEGDHCIYFYEGGSPVGRSICWNDISNKFDVDDTWEVSGNLLGGTVSATTTITAGSDISTTGAGDDLWLGAFTQALSNFKGYANGTLQNVDIHTGSAVVTGNISLNDVLISDWSEVNTTIPEVWVDESGDTMTGNLNMDEANITDANSGTYTYFRPGGAYVVHLEAG